MSTIERPDAVERARRLDAPLGGDRRRRALTITALLVLLLVGLVVAGTLLVEAAEKPDIGSRNMAPSLDHLFGTDWLGRDMLARTLVGLRLSLFIGVVASTISAVVALVLGSVAGAFGGRTDTLVAGLIDLFLAIPHLVLLILVAVAAGGGVTGVVVAVALTHWPSLARLLRGEARRVAASDYVALARRMGRSRTRIGREHLLGHLLPQASVGLVLLFPHAILHEAALSFLGLGLPPHQPAIGILLADSMRYLSVGIWWPAVLPGLSLLVVVKSVDVIGDQVRLLTDPRSAHE